MLLILVLWKNFVNFDLVVVFLSCCSSFSSWFCKQFIILVVVDVRFCKHCVVKEKKRWGSSRKSKAGIGYSKTTRGRRLSIGDVVPKDNNNLKEKA